MTFLHIRSRLNVDQTACSWDDLRDTLRMRRNNRSSDQTNDGVLEPIDIKLTVFSEQQQQRLLP